MTETDLNGFEPRYKRGDIVSKVGAGYSGPGKVFAVFLGEDRHWKYVIGHKIDKGLGCFYHIYGLGQLHSSKGK